MALPCLYILALPFSFPFLDSHSILPLFISLPLFPYLAFNPILLLSYPAFPLSLTSFLSFFPSIRLLIFISLLPPPTSLFRLSIIPLHLLYQPKSFSLTLLPLFLKSLFSLFSSSLSITPLSKPSSPLLCSPY